MSALIPMSREELQGLKAKLEKETRDKEIQDAAKSVYDYIVGQAKRVTSTTASFQLWVVNQRPYEASYHCYSSSYTHDEVRRLMNNVCLGLSQGSLLAPISTELVAGVLDTLRTLFPGCLVSYTEKFITDTKEVLDIGSINVDILRHLKGHRSTAFTVDWS